MPMCSLRLWGRYWVRTPTVKRPLFTQLLIVKSIIRNLPANGTAGLARFSDRTVRRSALSARQNHSNGSHKRFPMRNLRGEAIK